MLGIQKKKYVSQAIQKNVKRNLIFWYSHDAHILQFRSIDIFYIYEKVVYLAFWNTLFIVLLILNKKHSVKTGVRFLSQLTLQVGLAQILLVEAILTRLLVKKVIVNRYGQQRTPLFLILSKLTSFVKR